MNFLLLCIYFSFLIEDNAITLFHCFFRDILDFHDFWGFNLAQCEGQEEDEKLGKKEMYFASLTKVTRDEWL